MNDLTAFALPVKQNPRSTTITMDFKSFSSQRINIFSPLFHFQYVTLRKRQGPATGGLINGTTIQRVGLARSLSMVDARATRTTLIAGKIVRLSVPQMGVKGTECSLEHKTQPWTKVFFLY